MSRDGIIIINGPNLNLVGKRNPEIYGNTSFKEYLPMLQSIAHHHEIRYYQSNHEGDIIDLLHEFGFTHYGIILNAGGYTHTSVAIRDAIEAIEAPVIEVHISDIYNREPFRKHSYITEVCCHSIVGHGMDGYKMAVEYFVNG